MVRDMWPLSPSRTIDLTTPCVIGIVNATPDSFSDGGAHDDLDGLVAHARQLVRDGAGMLDIGGESTRPGAPSVDAAEQIARTVPVIRAVRAESEIPISIDTTSADVAVAALDAGADAINDVSAGADDPALLTLAAERGCGLVLMHRRCAPADDSWSNAYADAPTYANDDVVTAVADALRAAVERARAAGVRQDGIVLDPGFGFGKTVEQNLALLDGLDRLAALPAPLYVGVSRKSFLGALTGIDTPADRDPASIVAAVRAADRGVRLLRVHDVAGHVQALDVATRTRSVAVESRPL